jgi:hypothetical protein
MSEHAWLVAMLISQMFAALAWRDDPSLLRIAMYAWILITWALVGFTAFDRYQDHKEKLQHPQTYQPHPDHVPKYKSPVTRQI